MVSTLVWAFALFAMLYGLLVIKWMWIWKHLAETFTELQGGDEEKNLHESAGSSSRFKQALNFVYVC